MLIGHNKNIERGRPILMLSRRRNWQPALSRLRLGVGQFTPASGGREETWFGYGAGSGANPGAEYFVRLDPYAPLSPDVEPPSYCYDLDE